METAPDEPEVVRTPFVRVKCADCGNEQIAFRRAATTIICQVCGSTLAEPTGGMADFQGEIVEDIE